MLTPSTATLYLLTVWAKPVSVGDKPIFVDPRPLTFSECRTRRNQELTFYIMLRNADVYALCQQVIGE